jgi:hypothetical protein
MRYAHFFLIAFLPIFSSITTMEPIDTDGVTVNARTIYKDKIEVVSKEISQFSYPFNVNYFDTDEGKNKLKALNGSLEWNHLRVTIEKKPGTVEAVIQLVQLSDTDTGREDCSEIHRIIMPHDPAKNLNKESNDKINSARLHKIKELAIHLKDTGSDAILQAQNKHNSQAFINHCKKTFFKKITAHLSHDIGTTIAHSITYHLDNNFDFGWSIAQEATFLKALEEQRGLYKEARLMQELHAHYTNASDQPKYRKPTAVEQQHFVEKFEQAIASLQQ